MEWRCIEWRRVKRRCAERRCVRQDCVGQCRAKEAGGIAVGANLRFGLIGLSQGFYATVYTRIAATMKGIDVVGICDLGMPEDYTRDCIGMTASSFAHEIGAPLFHSLGDLLSTSPDAVMVASETHDHAAHALVALEAGAHVFVGKPIALLSQDIRRIEQVAAQRGLKVLPGQPARYDEGMVQAAERVRNGEIGRPLVARLLVNHEAMLSPAWERDPQRSGGPLGTFGIYCFDLVRWVTGLEFTEAFAYGENFTLKGQVDDLDNVVISARLTGGTIASICLTSSVRWTYPFLDLEIIGERGTLRAGYHNYPVVTQGPGVMQWPGNTQGLGISRAPDMARLSPVRYSPMNQNEIAHFIAVARGQEEPRISLTDALRAAELIEATRASIAGGSIVRMP